MKYRNQHGQLLLEILISLSVAAIIVVIGGQIIYLSMRGSKISGDRDVAVGIANETFEAAESSAVENWEDLYALTKGSTNYYPQKSAGKWVLISGSENVIINSMTYTRSFTVQNICRDDSTRNITGITDSGGSTTTCATSGGTHDPSAQRITTNVSWPNTDAISSGRYVTRWMNKVCVQTDWNSAGSGPSSCPATTYESVSNITPGASLQICGGGC